MVPLTIQLLSQERAPEVDEGLTGLGGPLAVGHPGDDRAAARNRLTAAARTEWQLAVEPGEVLAGGAEEILKTVAYSPPSRYRVQVIQGDVLTKQVRLWHRGCKAVFKNPVYETIPGDAPLLNVVLVGGDGGDAAERLRLATAWRDRTPTGAEPHYYLACALLENRRYDEFLAAANAYLFRRPPSLQAVTMTRYYVGLVEFACKKNAEAAAKNCLACVAANPLMSEFWCLLGDVYYHLLKKYDKAGAFYKNGKLLGSRRKADDPWPVQLSKYGEYPDQMVRSCDRLVSESRLIGRPS
jgi:tetratricopeptide (TPR) repeat protein